MERLKYSLILLMIEEGIRLVNNYSESHRYLTRVFYTLSKHTAPACAALQLGSFSVFSCLFISFSLLSLLFRGHTLASR